MDGSTVAGQAIYDVLGDGVFGVEDFGLEGFALFLDIGLPHRIWHPIVMWNPHSFLFEVAWCVMLYFTVTILELGPTILEPSRLSRVASLLHRVAPGVVCVVSGQPATMVWALARHPTHWAVRKAVGWP